MTFRRQSIALSCALALGLGACNGDDGTEPDPNGDGDPTFSGAVQPIFTQSCALSGCHTDPDPQEGMILAAGQAYANIVNVPSNQVPSLMRVSPNDPDASYLVHKIQGTQASVGGTGERMPFGLTPLSTAQINLISAWIESGAPNN